MFPLRIEQFLRQILAWDEANAIAYILATPRLLHVREEQSSGTNGGTFTSGAWRTRTLNTVVTNEITGASLASNQITLPAGTYYAVASAPCQFVGVHRAKLYDTTGTADLTSWLNGRTNSANDVDRAWTSGRFTLTQTSVIELQHYCATTAATTGFGVATSLGTEVYSDVQIWQVA